jgi:hypothetical protein
MRKGPHGLFVAWRVDGLLAIGHHRPTATAPRGDGMGLSAWMLENFVWEKLIAALVAVAQLGKALHAETAEILLMLLVGKFVTSALVGILAYLLFRWVSQRARRRSTAGGVRGRA